MSHFILKLKRQKNATFFWRPEKLKRAFLVLNYITPTPEKFMMGALQLIFLLFLISSSFQSSPPRRAPASEDDCRTRILSVIKRGGFLGYGKLIDKLGNSLDEGDKIEVTAKHLRFPIKLKFLSISTDPDGKYVIRGVGGSKFEKRIISIKEEDIVMIEIPKRKIPKNLVEHFFPEEILEIAKNVREHLETSWDISEFVYSPYRKLAGNETLDVVGNRFAKKKTGELTFSTILLFDEKMKKLNLALPSRSRIVLTENALFTTIGSPYSFIDPVPNIWDFKLRQVIKIKPYNFFAQGMNSTSDLLHERTHAILRATYSQNAFILRSNQIEEALADFFSTFDTKEIEAKVGLVEQAPPVRDMKTRTAYNRKGVPKVIETVADITEKHYHHNSLLISHFLEVMNDEIGVEKMRTVIIKVIDDLNSYYDSFKLLKNKEAAVKFNDRSSKEISIGEVEYFYTVILKLIQEDSELSSLQKNFDKVINSIAIDGPQIAKYTQQIHRSRKDYRHSGEVNYKDAMLVLIGGSLIPGVVIASYTTYEYLKPVLLDDKK